MVDGTYNYASEIALFVVLQSAVLKQGLNNKWLRNVICFYLCTFFK